MPIDEKPLEEQPLLSHFRELRSRLLRIVLGIVLGIVLSFYFSPQLYAQLSQPLIQVLPVQSASLIFINPVEPFFVYLKLSFVAALFLSSPWTFYQIWRFILPGLYANERHQMLPLVFFSSFFFNLGAYFCYAWMLPYALEVLISVGQTEFFSADPQISMASYLSLSLRLILAFGLAFEMPIFSYFLVRLGLIDHGQLIRGWRYAILSIFILAAILTPPDPLSQFGLALPMCLLYLLSIGIAYVARPRLSLNNAPTSATSEGR